MQAQTTSECLDTWCELRVGHVGPHKDRRERQQVYHAAPDHRLWDILENIAPHGLATPGDGDQIARHTRTHNDHLAREYHGASRAEWARMDVELRRTIVSVYRGRLRDGRTVMGPRT